MAGLITLKQLRELELQAYQDEAIYSAYAQILEEEERVQKQHEDSFEAEMQRWQELRASLLAQVGLPVDKAAVASSSSSGQAAQPLARYNDGETTTGRHYYSLQSSIDQGSFAGNGLPTQNVGEKRKRGDSMKQDSASRGLISHQFQQDKIQLTASGPAARRRRVEFRNEQGNQTGSDDSDIEIIDHESSLVENIDSDSSGSEILMMSPAAEYPSSGSPKSAGRRAKQPGSPAGSIRGKPKNKTIARRPRPAIGRESSVRAVHAIEVVQPPHQLAAATERPDPRVLANLPSGTSGKDVVRVPLETTRQVALCLASGRPVFYLDEKSGEVRQLQPKQGLSRIRSLPLACRSSVGTWLVSSYYRIKGLYSRNSIADDTMQRIKNVYGASASDPVQLLGGSAAADARQHERVPALDAAADGQEARSDAASDDVDVDVDAIPSSESVQESIVPDTLGDFEELKKVLLAGKRTRLVSARYDAIASYLATGGKCYWLRDSDGTLEEVAEHSVSGTMHTKHFGVPLGSPGWVLCSMRRLATAATKGRITAELMNRVRLRFYAHPGVRTSAGQYQDSSIGAGMAVVTSRTSTNEGGRPSSAVPSLDGSDLDVDASGGKEAADSARSVSLAAAAPGSAVVKQQPTGSAPQQGIGAAKAKGPDLPAAQLLADLPDHVPMEDSVAVAERLVAGYPCFWLRKAGNSSSSPSSGDDAVVEVPYFGASKASRERPIACKSSEGLWIKTSFRCIRRAQQAGMISKADMRQVVARYWKSAAAKRS